MDNESNQFDEFNDFDQSRISVLESNLDSKILFIANEKIDILSI